jgi:endonuclease III
MQNYRGQPPLSNGAFRVLQRLVKAAAENLERCLCSFGLYRQQALAIASLSNLTLEELASDEMDIRLQNSLEGFHYKSKVVN